MEARVGIEHQLRRVFRNRPLEINGLQGIIQTDKDLPEQPFFSQIGLFRPHF